MVGMADTDRTVIGLVALAAFLATILAVVRGSFAYPVELFLVTMLGILLVASLASQGEGAFSALLPAIFFSAVLANMAYLYTVAGYVSPARAGTIVLAIIGLLLSVTNLIAQPVPAAPAALTSEARKLLAAEKRLSDARQKLEMVKDAMPAKAKAKRVGKRGASSKRRK